MTRQAHSLVIRRAWACVLASCFVATVAVVTQSAVAPARRVTRAELLKLPAMIESATNAERRAKLREWLRDRWPEALAGYFDHEIRYLDVLGFLPLRTDDPCAFRVLLLSKGGAVTAHVVDAEGDTVWRSEVSPGWGASTARAYLEAGAGGHARPIIEIAELVGPPGRGQRVYYAVLEHRVALIRIEDELGEATIGTGRARSEPDHEGPSYDIPTLLGVLERSDRALRLEALTWLDAEPPEPAAGIAREDPRVIAACRKLCASPDAWTAAASRLGPWCSGHGPDGGHQ